MMPSTPAACSSAQRVALSCAVGAAGDNARSTELGTATTLQGSCLEVALWQQVLRPPVIRHKVPLLLHQAGVLGCQGAAVARLVASTDGTAPAPGAGLHPCLPLVVVPTSAPLAQPPGRQSCGGGKGPDLRVKL